MGTNHHQQRAQKTITATAVAGLLLLLLLPAAASFRLCPPMDFRWLLGYWLVISTITHVIYRDDKKRAELRQWRTPESTLHLLELLGGWAAAFLAQREFRHKISKGSYQQTFWAIVILYQIVAFDFLLGWTITRTLWRGLVSVGHGGT